MSKGSRASVCECKWLACSNTGLLDAESRLDITTRGTFLESCDWTGHALACADFPTCGPRCVQCLATAADASAFLHV